MRNLRQYLFHISSIIILLLSCIKSEAAHIVGGDVTYQFVRFNNDTSRVTFRIVFTMYRDQFSGGAQFDNNATFGVFRQALDGNWFVYDIVNNINNGAVRPIPRVDDPCVDEPSNVGVQESSYIFDVTLEIGNTNYMVAYQRCCRNETITNILDPGETGAVFDVVITPKAQREGNNSPTFNSFPPIFICADGEVNFDHSATDAEGDILRYTFCAPFANGGTFDAMTGNLGCCDCVRPEPNQCPPEFPNVVYRPPFTKNAPLAGNPIVSIDNITGLISGVPELIGQYVVGVCVEEFRDGELISTVRRDFQFNVVTCTPNVFAQLESDDEIDLGGLDGRVYFINSCGQNTVTIENSSFNENEIFAYHWTFLNPDGSVLLDEAGGTEIRDITVTFPELGEYTGRMILNEGTECSDSANFAINIYPSIYGDYDFLYDTCVSGPVSYIDQSSTDGDQLVSWDWNFGDGNSSSIQSPVHTYDDPGLKRVTLVVEDNNECKDTVIQEVSYFPVPQLIVVEPSSFLGCLPANITFNNLSTPIDTSYDIFWDFGDGNMSLDISPQHEYLASGIYSVSVDIVSPLGCETSKEFVNWIRILDGPVADFSFSPEEPNVFQQTVQFTDLSLDAGAWQWNFGGIGNAFVKNPTFAFPDTGTYKVLLTAFHPLTSCPDTISKIIDIKPVVRFFYPNAFTPNNDGRNDLFLGRGYSEGLSDYILQIFNRWGERVFITDDPLEGWNGQANNVGNLSPQGVYVYKVSYSGPRGEKESQEGHLTLIR